MTLKKLQEAQAAMNNAATAALMLKAIKAENDRKASSSAANRAVDAPFFLPTCELGCAIKFSYVQFYDDC